MQHLLWLKAYWNYPETYPIWVPCKANIEHNFPWIVFPEIGRGNVKIKDKLWVKVVIMNVSRSCCRCSDKWKVIRWIFKAFWTSKCIEDFDLRFWSGCHCDFQVISKKEVFGYQSVYEGWLNLKLNKDLL